MRCPKCLHLDSKVNDSRPKKQGSSIRRRRECLKCGHRFTTIEEVMREDLVVKKRDGSREDYDRSKLLKGIRRACYKRPIALEVLDEVVQDITTSLQNRFESEIPSQVIGEEIIERLKKIDQIAYVRFASVYKDFHDISQLAEEIRSLKKVNTA